MSLVQISEKEYHLTDRNGRDIPGLENAVFGESSEWYLDQLKSVEFTRAQGMMPPSILEAIALRAYSGDSKSSENQVTRTAAFLGVKNGKVYIAFDDIPDAGKNLAIARVQKGYDLSKPRSSQELIIRGEILNEVLKRAEKDGRVLPMPDCQIDASFAEYGTNRYFVAMEGCMASVNARLIQSLQSRGITEGSFGLPPHEYVLEHVKEGEAMVQSTILCGGGIGGALIFAFNGLGGFVRGVRNAPTFAEVNTAWKIVEESK